MRRTAVNESMCWQHAKINTPKKVTPRANPRTPKKASLGVMDLGTFSKA